MTVYTSPQDGSTIDTHIASNAQTTNYISDATIYSGEYTGATIYGRALLQFPDLTNGIIPRGAHVVSAKLYLKISGDYANNARTHRIYRSKRDVNLSQCTYSIYKTGSNWQTAGGFGADDCEQTDIGSAAFSAAESIGTWKEFSLTASAIQEIINGVWTTPTLFIKADTEIDDEYGFCSSNVTTSTDRPYIVIDYLFGQVILWGE